MRGCAKQALMLIPRLKYKQYSVLLLGLKCVNRYFTVDRTTNNTFSSLGIFSLITSCHQSALFVFHPLSQRFAALNLNPLEDKRTFFVTYVLDNTTN